MSSTNKPTSINFIQSHMRAPSLSTQGKVDAMLTKATRLVTAFLVLGLLSACGGEEGASAQTDAQLSDDGNSREIVGETTQLSGSATKGRLAFATVRVSRYDGGAWQAIGETETDGQGAYTIDIARDQAQGLLQVAISPRLEGDSLLECDWPAGCGVFPSGVSFSEDRNRNGAVDFGEWRPLPPGFVLKAWLPVSEAKDTLTAHVSVLTHLVSKQAAESAVTLEALVAANTEVAAALGLRGSLAALQPVSPAQLVNDSSLEARLPRVEALLYGAMNAAVVGAFGDFENFLAALAADRGDFKLALSSSDAAGVAIDPLIEQSRDVLKSVAGLSDELMVLVREAQTLLLAQAGTVVETPIDNQDHSDDAPANDVPDTDATDTDATDTDATDTQTSPALTDIEKAKQFLRQLREMISLGEGRLPVWETQLDNLANELRVTGEVLEPELMAAVQAMEAVISVGQNVMATQDLEEPFSITEGDLTFASEGLQSQLVPEAGQALSSDVDQGTLQVTVSGAAPNSVSVELLLDAAAEGERLSEGAPEWAHSNAITEGALTTGLAGTLVSGETTITLTQTAAASGILHRSNYRYRSVSEGVLVDSELHLALGITAQRGGTNPIDFTGRIKAEWVVDQYQFRRDFFTGQYKLQPLRQGYGEPLVAYLDTLMIEGLVALGGTAADAQNALPDQALAFSISLTDVEGFYEAYENGYVGHNGEYQYDFAETDGRFKGYLKAEVGFVPQAGEWVGLSLQGGAELAYEYLDYHYRGQWGDHQARTENLTQDFVPSGATIGFKLNGQQFSLGVVDQTEQSEDRFCGGDAALWQITNQENVSMLLNISEQCNFGKLALVGDSTRTLGTLEQRDNIWMIHFVDGTFETLF